MPRGDRTGPAGMGPMTGRAAGYCAGYAAPGYLNPTVPGGGYWGWGRGGGRGHRNWFYATGLPGWARTGAPAGWGGVPYGSYPVPVGGKEEIDLLQGQASSMETALEDVRRRINELEADAKKGK